MSATHHWNGLGVSFQNLLKVLREHNNSGHGPSESALGRNWPKTPKNKAQENRYF